MNFTLTKKSSEVKVVRLQEAFLSSVLKSPLFSYLDFFENFDHKKMLPSDSQSSHLIIPLTQLPVILPHILFPLVKTEVLARILFYVCMYSLIYHLLYQVGCKPHEQTDPIIVVTYIPSVFSANYERLFAK